MQSFEEFYDTNEHPTFFELACRNRFGYFELKLVERVQQSREVFLFTFEFCHGTDDLEEFDDVAPIEEWILGAKAGHPVYLVLQINGKLVKRKFCPISMVNDLSTVTFAIKIFKDKGMDDNNAKETEVTEKDKEENRDEDDEHDYEKAEEPEEEEYHYMGAFTEYLHKEIGNGDIVMIDNIGAEEEQSLPDFKGESLI